MTEITISSDLCLARAFPRGRIETNETALAETLTMLGEDVTAGNPPIDILFTNATRSHVGCAEQVDGHRKLSLGVRQPIVPGLPLRVWRSNRDINKTLIHELVHIVDFLDPEIMEAQRIYMKRFDRATKLGRLAAETIYREASKFSSPMEKHAYDVVERLRKARSLPRIVRIVW